MGRHRPLPACVFPLNLRGWTRAWDGKGQCPSAEPFPGLLCVFLEPGTISSAVAEAEQGPPATSSPPEGLSNIQTFGNVLRICWQIVRMKRQCPTRKLHFCGLVLMLCCAVCGVQGFPALTFQVVKENFCLSKMIRNALPVCPPMF